MKRFLIYLLLTIAVLLAGCQTDSMQSGPTGGTGYDAQNKYLLSNNPSFQETDTVFCGSYWNGNYLYYYDKTTGTSGVLCADPSCTHDSYTCSAYIMTGASPCYYNGKLYWVGADRTFTDFCLWRSDLTGLNREKVKPDFSAAIYTYMPQRYTIHRGRLYFIGFNTNVESTESGYRMSLVSTSLDDSEEFTAIFDRTTNLAMMPTMRFSGSCAYFSWYREDENGEEVFTIEKYDTETETYEIVLEKVGTDDLAGKFWVTEEGEVYTSGTKMSEGEKYHCLWKIENGELTEVSSWAPLSTRDTYSTIMDGIVLNDTRIDGVRYCTVRNFAGEILYEGMMFPEENPGIVGDPNELNYAIVGGDVEKIIIALRSTDGDLAYTLLLDLQDNLTATILWGDELVINKG